MRRFVPLSLGLLTLLAVAPFHAAIAEDQLPARTALDDYVQAPDDTYAWEVVGTEEGDGYTTYIIDLKSQTWRAPNEVDRTVWQHWLTIVKPDEVKTDKGFMFIGGGSNGGEPPTKAEDMIRDMALATGSVVSQIRMIPNQPLVFMNDGVRRKEDNLIAYTWIKHIETGDDLWAARLPMVKSVVRGMDTVQALMASEQGGNVEVNQFVVAGGSKRGWTTWLTGVADDRVCAIVPIVIDVLNVEKSMLHHWAAYGFWAPAIGDYVMHKCVRYLGMPQNRPLMDLVDPYSYRHRLTMPKLICNSTGDQFFLPDSSQFYFDDLQGESHLCYVPNSEHSMGGTDVLSSVLAFYRQIINKTPRPKYEWSRVGTNGLRIDPETKPQKVLLWRATNPDARDFRVSTIGRAYKSNEVEPGSNGSYEVTVADPEQGFTAFFLEMQFEGDGPEPLKMSTEVRVVPDVLPHKNKPRQKP